MLDPGGEKKRPFGRVRRRSRSRFALRIVLEMIRLASHLRGMRVVWITLALLLLEFPVSARETAYDALRTLARQRGQSMLNRVLQVKGTKGSPQPAVWTIVVDEPSSRGGFIEFQITNGRVVGERLPARDARVGGTVMNFKRLNLDSDGAFTLANQEAAKAKVGFDLLDYELRSDRAGQTPVWFLQLHDAQGGSVSTLAVSADTGAVLRRNLAGGQGRNAPDGDASPSRRGDGDLPPERGGEIRVHDVDRRDRDRRDRTDNEDYDDNEGDLGHAINKHLHRGAATVQEWITGRRTLDRRYEGEP